MECNKGQYSYKTDQYCKPCQAISGHDECLGRGQTIIQEGFWRDTQYSEDITKCDKKMICSNSRKQRLKGGNHLC